MAPLKRPSPFQVMKALLPLLLLVGLATAKPTAKAFDLSSLPSDPNSISREVFAQELPQFKFITEFLADSLVPKEFIEFVRSITVDDYDGLKFVMDNVGKIPVEQLRSGFEKDFPDLYGRFMKALNGFLARCDALSLEARQAMMKAMFLEYRLKGKYGSYERTRIISTYLKSFSDSIKTEIDSLFPNASTLLPDSLEDEDGLYNKEEVEKMLDCSDPSVNDACEDFNEMMKSGDLRKLYKFLKDRKV
ncbi:hypothetical protein QR680_018579 [Steinernema hermaphroditum]|uniref:Fatty-acid and retinol-binding protein 1 n=1 Tax=Steinernema hermaphroditum TaxID=289476 RepID=A0AA39HIE2_9BILA|nr:hypothetical protein QR680_018579 [Steinernema hermaphroditum]